MPSKPNEPPLLRDDIEATRRPFAEASSLSGPPYRDPGIFAAELEEIFFSMWTCVGHRDALAAPGSFLTREIGGESVLVVGAAEHEARAFYNVCRHRGTRLIDEPDGSGLGCIRCPYHAWSYGLDGELIAAPLMDEVAGFAREDYPLSPIRLETWEGFLFVCLDDDAAPLADQMSDFPDISRFGMPTLRVGARKQYDVAANWKLICENYGECYHCPTNHPQLNPISRFSSGGDSFEGGSFCGGPMRLNEGCTTMTLTGQTDRAPIAGLDAADHGLVRYFNIYPALLLSLHPDYVLIHTIWPVDASHSRIICEWLFSPQAAEAAGFDPSDAVDFWHMTNEQDWQICERAQKGVTSRGYRPGRYQSLEETIYFFDNWYLRRMAAVLLDDEGAGAGGAPASPAPGAPAER